jgi:hypothetical protein
MKKLLLLSIIFATIAVPARAAKIKNPRVGIRKAIRNMVIFDVIYVVAVLLVWPRL